MTYHDQNMRDRDARRPMANRGYGMGVPLAIAAVALIAGLLFWNMGDHRTTTASNNTPTTTQSGPTTGSGPGITTNPPATPR